MLREHQKPPLKMILLWMALDKLTGRGKEIDRAPMSSYRRRSEPQTGSKHRKASNYQPPPLVQSLPRRKGYITPPELEIEKLDQLQSPLFTLPREVLLLIYEQVIGNNVLHIVRRPNKLSHATCCNNSSGSPDDCRDMKCRGIKLPNGVCVPDGRDYGDLLPLLRTCRKIYIDAIQVLYTSNTFDFDCMESIISFSTCIIPHRFDSIKNIQLDLRFNYSHSFNEGTPSNDYARWERMWRIIGSMKNLQHLWCHITWWRTDLTGAEEARYLSELLQVGYLRVFEIRLPTLKWNDPKDKEIGGTFEVVRRK